MLQKYFSPQKYLYFSNNEVRTHYRNTTNKDYLFREDRGSGREDQDRDDDPEGEDGQDAGRHGHIHRHRQVREIKDKTVDGRLDIRFYPS